MIPNYTDLQHKVQIIKLQRGRGKQWRNKTIFGKRIGKEVGEKQKKKIKALTKNSTFSSYLKGKFQKGRKRGGSNRIQVIWLKPEQIHEASTAKRGSNHLLSREIKQNDRTIEKNGESKEQAPVDAEASEEAPAELYEVTWSSEWDNSGEGRYIPNTGTR